MYAVIQDRGKQYTVEAGTQLHVDRMEAEPGSAIVFDRVLLLGGEGDVSIGTPTVEGSAVQARVVGEHKGRKIVVFKKKRRKRYRRKQGHRQKTTIVEIVSVG